MPGLQRPRLIREHPPAHRGRSVVAATLLGIAAACSDATTTPRGVPVAAHTVSADVAVGDTVLLNVRVGGGADADNVGTGSADCGTPNLVKARVAAVTARAVVAYDTRDPAPGFTDAQYATVGATFDTLVWPVDTRHFGVPTDVDGNGRVLIFYTRAVNALTPAGADYYIGGFFYARDLLPTTGAHACAGSNGGEIFYLLAPDPDGAINGNRRDPAFVARVSTGTVAHEFQHLINAARRLYVRNEQNVSEEVWLDEGLSHLAEELTFYQAAGFSPAGQPGQSPRARLTRARLAAQPNGLAALSGFGAQNLSRLSIYLAGTERFAPYTENDSLATRGATWSFLRYAADHTGRSDSAFFYPLVNGGATGVANVRAVLAALGGDGSAAATLEDVLRDWAVSTSADGAAADATVRYAEPSWIFRDVLTTLPGFTTTTGLINDGRYPLAMRALADGVPQSFVLGGGSAAYLRFTVPGRGTATLRTAAGGVAPASNVRIALVSTTGPSDAGVTTYDGPASAVVSVPNASSGPVAVTMVVLNVNSVAASRQPLTIVGAGLGAPPGATLGAVVAAGPTRARLAAASGDPVMSDAVVMHRVRASLPLAITPRLESARVAYRAARRTGDLSAWRRPAYLPGTVRGLVVQPPQ